MPARIVLTAVALWTPRGRPVHHLHPVGLAARFGLCAWTLMFAALLPALLFASPATPTITRWT